MHHSNLPGELLQSPFEEYRKPLDGGIIRENQAIGLNQPRRHLLTFVQWRERLGTHANLCANATLENPVNLPYTLVGGLVHLRHPLSLC